MPPLPDIINEIWVSLIEYDLLRSLKVNSNGAVRLPCIDLLLITSVVSSSIRMSITSHLSAVIHVCGHLKMFPHFLSVGQNLTLHTHPN